MKKSTRRAAPSPKGSPRVKSRASSSPAAAANAQYAEDQQKLAQAMPFNAGKAAEYGYATAIEPPTGASVKPPSDTAAASTLSEGNGTAKTG